MPDMYALPPASFTQFVFKQHREMLLFAVPGMLILFVSYKIIYPLPDTYFDSFHYIGLARKSIFPSLWPPGYSRFLKAVHTVYPSHYLLVTVQYLLLQLSSFWLVFTLFYYVGPPHWVRVTVVGFLVLNPLYLYLANLISSDVLFTALSFCWLAILIRLIADARFWHVLVQGPLLAYLFIIRYQAAGYAVVMLLALWFSQITWFWRVFSALIAFCLLGWVIKTAKNTNFQRVGNSRLSAQGGWMMANNALYMYPYIRIDTAAFSSPELVRLNSEVHQSMVAKQLMTHNFVPADGPQFMFSSGPLWQPLVRLMEADKKKHFLMHYHALGFVYADYGEQLIKAYPLAYFRYYILPNTVLYLLPLPEQFAQYTMGSNRIEPAIAQWLGMPDNHVYCWWPQGGRYLLWVFRPFFLLIHIGLMWGAGMKVVTGAWRRLPPLLLKIFVLLLVVLLGNACVLILAGPVMLRYQVCAMVTGFVMLCLLAARKY